MASLVIECEASENDIHCKDIEAILVHNDILLTAADDGKVKVWSTKDLSIKNEFSAHDYAICHLLILEDTLYTASVDQTIKVWQMNTWKHKATLTGHEEGIHRLATDGEFVYSGDDKGEVRQWTKDGKLCLVFGFIEEVWDLHVVGKLVFTIRDKDLIVAELKEESEKYCIVFAHPGRAPLEVKGNYVIFAERGGMDIVVLENTQSGFQKKFTLKKHEMIVTTISSWSHYLASTGYDQQLHLWDLKKGAHLASSPVKGTISAMAGSNEALFVGGADGYLAKFKLQ